MVTAARQFATRIMLNAPLVSMMAIAVLGILVGPMGPISGGGGVS